MKIFLLILNTINDIIIHVMNMTLEQGLFLVVFMLLVLLGYALYLVYLGLKGLRNG